MITLNNVLKVIFPIASTQIKKILINVFNAIKVILLKMDNVIIIYNQLLSKIVSII